MLLGLNSAIAILVPVSFGEQDYKNCARVLQRGRLICFLVYLALTVPIALSYRVLISINVDVVVAGKAYQYASLLFIAMLFHS